MDESPYRLPNAEWSILKSKHINNKTETSQLYVYVCIYTYETIIIKGEEIIKIESGVVERAKRRIPGRSGERKRREKVVYFNRKYIKKCLLHKLVMSFGEKMCMKKVATVSFLGIFPFTWKGDVSWIHSALLPKVSPILASDVDI